MIQSAWDPGPPQKLTQQAIRGRLCGVCATAPATLPSISVVHDALGKPAFDYAPKLAQLLSERGLVAHLSISDEKELVAAFVVLEQGA